MSNMKRDLNDMKDDVKQGKIIDLAEKLEKMGE